MADESGAFERLVCGAFVPRPALGKTPGCLDLVYRVKKAVHDPFWHIRFVCVAFSLRTSDRQLVLPVMEGELVDCSVSRLIEFPLEKVCSNGGMC